MSREDQPTMRIAAEIYFVGQNDPLRLGHTVHQDELAPDQPVQGVERIALYDAGTVSAPKQIDLDEDPPVDKDRPVLILDPIPDMTSIRRRNNPVGNKHYFIKGQFRCWVAPESRVDLEIEFHLDGRIGKLEIGKELKLHEQARLDRDVLLALERHSRMVLKCPAKRLRGSGDRKPAEFLDQVLAKLSKSADDDVSLHACFVGLCDRVDENEEPVLRLGFELKVAQKVLRRLTSAFLPNTLTDTDFSAIEKRSSGDVEPESDWPGEVFFRQGPRGWPAEDDQQKPYGRSGNRLPEETYLLDCEGPPNRVAAALWNCWVDDHLRHSETVQNGQPRSFVPRLDCSLEPTTGVDGGWHVVWEGKVGDERDLDLDFRGRFLGQRPASERVLRLFLPQLRNHRGEIPLVSLRAAGDALEKPCDEGEPDTVSRNNQPWRHLHRIAEQPGLVLEVRHEVTVHDPGDFEKLEPDQKRLRMGSLDLELGTADHSSEDLEPRFRQPGVYLALDPVARSGCEACATGTLPDRYSIGDTEIELYFSIADVSAGGQDGDVDPFPIDCRDLPPETNEDGTPREPKDWREAEERIECGFHRQRPLVIPDPWLVPDDGDPDPFADEPKKPQLVLRVAEARDRVRGARLDMDLFRTDATGGSPTQGDPCAADPKQLDRVMVLDPDPFFAAVVAHEPLGSLGDPSTGTEIATWRSRGLGAGAWHLHLPSRQGFCLSLPPQGVGETMERYKTLDESERADFRFGPPARLSMRATYFEQNFPEAPWNLRRLLTRPGRELPGAELEAAHLELLYGLSCHMELDDRMVRLAEVATLVGAVPGPLGRFPQSAPHERWLKEEASEEQEEAYYQYRKFWSRLFDQLTARLAIFEVWDPARLSALRQREGVSCWIRTPDGFYPGPGPKPTAPERLKGLPTADLAHPIETLDFSDDTCPPDQLCGGVTWGFESRNVFEATVRPDKVGDEKTWPRSTAAELSDLRLSALGAWGHQMAAFDNNLTTIYGDVAMGRTFSYRIERIGRIGVFWHRAKHVIIYERSVVPSRQFMGDQNPLGGRPVLRKVREFVEILENERSYPDSGGGTARQLGFVRRMTFATQADEVVRFHVKSAWGTDLDWDRPRDGSGSTETVEESGWKVPIWIRGAAPTDVFPRPRIRVTVASVIEGETLDVERYIDNPENLYFFTRTTDGAGDPQAADTNSWPSVPGVDYVDRPRPSVQPDEAFRTGRLKQTQPSDRLVPSGHGVTTFLLEPSAHGADLTVHRSGDPMSSKVRSFTMSRSGKGPPSSGQPFTDPRKAVGDAFGKVLQLLPEAGAVGQKHKEAIGRALDQVAAEARRAQGSIKDVRNEAGQVKETFDKWAQADLVEKAWEASKEPLERELRRFLGKDGGSQLEKALRPLVEQLVAKKRAGDEDQAIRDHAHREVEKLVADLATKMALLTPSPLALSSQVLAAGRRALGELDRIVEEGQRLEKEAEASAAEVLAAPGRLEQHARSWLARIDDLLDSVVEAAESGRRVAIEVDSRAQKLSLPGIGRKVLGRLGDDAKKKLRDSAQKARRAADALRALAVRAKAGVDQTGQVVLEERLKLETRIQKEVLDLLKEASAGLDIFEGAAQDLRAEVGKIEKGILDLEQAKLEKIQALADELETTGKLIVDGVIDGAIFTAQHIEKAVADWLSPADDWIKGVQTTILDQAKLIEDQAKIKFAPAVADVKKALSEIETRAGQLKSQLEDAGDQARRQLEQERDRLLADLEQEYGEELRTLRRLKGKVDAVAEPGLRLVRAFGEPPEVKGLQFDRPETAFIFGELDDKVGITPVIGRVAQAANVARAVGDVLEPLGIDLPVKELGEKLIPEDLKNFQLSDILPDIAGLRLDKLFSGITMPDTGDDLKVRHGIDPKTRRAFFNAELDTVIEENATIFATGPLELAIVQPRFFGKVDAQIDTRGQVQRTVDGKLSGDWQMTIGGQLVLIIRQTTLEFDESGDLRFQIRPEQVELTETMKFVSDLLQTISPDVDGLTIKIEPTGISSVLMLPLPDMQAGTSGITGLSLGASLVLRWADTDSKGRSGFSIALAFNLAHPERPFALTIFILGGGGYLTVDSKYFPTTGLVETEVRMAITASASLAISLGPLSGGVFVYFGMTTSYSAANGALDIGVIILIVGRVSVLGIVSASVHLGLEVMYRNKQLVGRGFVSLTIKICWCFTLKVRKSVTYKLGGGGGGGSSRLPSSPTRGAEGVTRLAQFGGSLPIIEGGNETSAMVDESYIRERVRLHLKSLA